MPATHTGARQPKSRRCPRYVIIGGLYVPLGLDGRGGQNCDAWISNSTGMEIGSPFDPFPPRISFHRPHGRSRLFRGEGQRSGFLKAAPQPGFSRHKRVGDRSACETLSVEVCHSFQAGVREVHRQRASLHLPDGDQSLTMQVAGLITIITSDWDENSITYFAPRSVPVQPHFASSRTMHILRLILYL